MREDNDNHDDAYSVVENKCVALCALSILHPRSTNCTVKKPNQSASVVSKGDYC